MAIKLKNNNTNIDMTLVKKLIDIVTPFTYICNLSLQTGIFPNTAKVIPIFKRGETQQYANYRLISLLPTFSKILEKTFCGNVCEHKLLDTVWNIDLIR